MRFSSVALAAALAGLSIATSLQGQAADVRLDPRSVALVAKARSLRAAGDLNGATDLLETALAVDPRNRGAVLELADVAEAEQLPGKAIRYYRQALALQPNDVHALKGQGEAMVMKGAIKSAQDNLARIRSLCAKTGCPEANQLAAVIAKGPPVSPPQATAKADVGKTATPN